MNESTSSIPIKTTAQIEKMRTAGKLAAAVLDYVTPFVVTDVSTGYNVV